MKPTFTIHFAILFFLTSICASVFAQNVTVNSSQLTGGLSVSPLVGGTTGAAIFGFTLDKAGGGTNTVTGITISFTQDPSITFSSAALYSSSDNSFGVGDLSIASGTLNSTSIVFTGAPITNFGNANGNTSANFFLVVTVSPSVTGATAATTPSLTGANVTTSPAATGSVTGNSYSFASLAATITGTGSTRNMVAGSSAQTLATFTAASTGTAQTLSQIDFVFSVDIASIFNTFTLNNGSADVGTPSYTAGTKTLTFTAIGDPLTTAPLNYTLKANVASGAGTSSQTVALSNSGVTVTGGGVVNAFTTITNTLNVTALTATISGIGATRNMVAGSTTQTLATFSTISSGSSQTLSQVDFVFSVDIASIFNTFTLNNGSSNVGTPTYTAGTKTLSFASIGDAITTSTTSYTLRANVAGAAGPSSQTVALSNAGISVSGGGSVNGFSTITNTLNVTYSQSSIIELNGGVTNPINFAEYNKQTTSGLTTGNSTSLAQFRIRDGGLSNNDTDSQPTTLDALTLSITNFANLKTIALFDGSSIVPGTEQSVSTGTVVFSGPLGLVANDDANKNFSVRATFKANVTDNQFIQVTIANATANSGGSLFSSSNAGGAQTNGGTDNQIQVVATDLSFSTPPINTPPNTNFSITVSTVDANGNLDVNQSNTVALSKIVPSSGPGVLSAGAPENLSQNVSGGVFTWNRLRISLAGSYNINGTYGGSGIADNSFTIVIKSPGVKVTPASALDVCIGGNFQPLGSIKIEEQDPADLGQANNQTFMLKLPSGFIFDTSLTPTPTFTASRNLSSPSTISYIGNNIMRFSYNIGGTNLLDDFTISGLNVKYIGTTPVAPDKIRVVNSSAIMLGNYEVDDQNHGLLSASNASNAGVDFDVFSFPGQSPFQPNQVSFSYLTSGVIMKPTPLPNPAGNLTGVVFSGNGVSYSISQNQYVFSPAAVGVGNYSITMTGTNGSGCVVSFSKTFQVYAGNITGLQSQYCVNDNTTQTLSVDPLRYNIAQYYAAWSNALSYNQFSYVSFGGNAYYSLINGNLNVPPGSDPTKWQIVGYSYAGNDFVINVPSYKNITSITNNGTGTITITSPSHGFANGSSQLLYSYVYNASYTLLLFYIPYQQYVISNVTTDTFDINFNNPTSGTFTSISGSVNIPNPTVSGAINNGNSVTVLLTNHGMKNGQTVFVYLSGLSANGISNRINNWYTISNVTANTFDITTPGVTGTYTGSGYVDIFSYRVNSFKPSDASNLNSNFGTVTSINFGFMVSSLGCTINASNTCAPFVYSYDPVTLNQLTKVDFVLPATYCANDPSATLTELSSLDGTFSGSGITDGGPNNPSGLFNPASPSVTVNANTAISFSFTDNNGCTNTISKNTIVKPLPTVSAGPATQVCSGSGVTIGGSPTAIGTAPFTYSWNNGASLNNPSLPNPTASPTVNTTYTVAVSDKFGCSNTSNVAVQVNAPASVNAGSPFTICEGTSLTMSSVSPTIGGSATLGFWSSTTGGTFTLNSSGSTFSAATYTPSPIDVAARAVTLRLTTNDPDGAGPCLAASDVVIITINRRATVDAGVDKTFCAGNPINLNNGDATINFGGSASSVTWSVPTGGGTISNATSISTALYNPSPSELTNGVVLPFFLTTNDPDGAGPCTAASDQAQITINQAATVSVGPDQLICADQNISLTGSFGGGASSATWTTLNASGAGFPYTSSSNPVALTYSLSTSEKNTGSALSLLFVLTTNDPDGPGPCTAVANTIPVRVSVNPIPKTPVLTLPIPPIGQTAYCVNDVIQPVLATGSAGSQIVWYSDAGLTTSVITSTPTGVLSFTPPVSNSVQQTTSFYITEKSGGCESKGQIPGSAPAIYNVVVNPRPSLSFTVNNLCLSPTDAAQFDASSSSISTAVFPTAAIAGYQWDFADGTPIAPFSPTAVSTTHQYGFASTFDATLLAISNEGCTSSVKSSNIPTSPSAPNQNGINPLLGKNKPLRIGNYPVPKVSFTKQCLGDPTAIDGFDNSLNLNNDKASNIWRWDLGDGTITTTNSLGTPKENQTSLTHQYATIGVKPVFLTITTNLGCMATNAIPVNLPILPYVTPTVVAPYQQSFEGTNGGWVPDGFNQNPVTLAVTNTSSWRRTSAFGASAGNEAWITNVDIGGGNFTYYPNERSVLYGPCFNINNNLTKPVFSIDYLKDIEAGNDGAYIEVSIDDGATWSVLGNLSQGLEWYDQGGLSGVSISPPITNLIGQTVGQFGWTGRSNTWKTGKFQLDSYINETRLRVRVVFGSNGNNPTNFNGFALDNIKVENRNRVMLAEAFTNLSAPGATVRNTDFKNFVSNNPELVKIQYHTNFGGTDVNNGLNPGDPQARAIFYGVATPFRGFLDGFSTGNGLITTTNNPNPPSNDWSVNYYGRRSLAAAPLDISINTTNNATDVTINATIQILSADLPPSSAGSPRYFAFLAIVEQVNGEFIFRKFLPNASGTPLTKIKATQTQTITGQWQTSAPYDPNNLYVICFVQDIEGTQAGIKEVLQSGIAKLPVTSVVTGFEPPGFANLSFYPIPADKELVVSLPEVATQNTTLVMYDAVGKSVQQTAIEKGQQSKTVNTQDFAPGVYLIQLETDKGTVRKKVMVVH